MIINGYDGRNIAIVVPAEQAKMLVALLEQQTIAQAETAGKVVNADGFHVTTDDVVAAAGQFVLTLRRITNALHFRDICSQCGASKEEAKKQEDPTSIPDTAPKKDYGPN